MVKMISVSLITLCLAVNSLSVPGYRLNVELDSKNNIYEEMLKKDLQDELIEIEKTLNYSSQIEILDLKYERNVLTIDLSKEITLYGGGNTAEQYVCYALLTWGFENTKAEFVSLLVEGEMNTFPEGGDYTLYMRGDYETNIKPILLE